MVPAPDTNLVATFAGLELLVGDVHLLGTERAGAVSVVAHGHHWRWIRWGGGGGGAGGRAGETLEAGRGSLSLSLSLMESSRGVWIGLGSGGKEVGLFRWRNEEALAGGRVGEEEEGEMGWGLFATTQPLDPLLL